MEFINLVNILKDDYESKINMKVFIRIKEKSIELLNNCFEKNFSIPKEFINELINATENRYTIPSEVYLLVALDLKNNEYGLDNITRLIIFKKVEKYLFDEIHFNINNKILEFISNAILEAGSIKKLIN
ncbi:hypothetical protein, partial [Clostridium tarantellae]